MTKILSLWQRKAVDSWFTFQLLSHVNSHYILTPTYMWLFFLHLWIHLAYEPPLMNVTNVTCEMESVLWVIWARRFISVKRKLKQKGGNYEGLFRPNNQKTGMKRDHRAFTLPIKLDSRFAWMPMMKAFNVLSDLRAR